MSTPLLTCYALECDFGTHPECMATFIDSDTEVRIHANSAEDIRSIAAHNEEWITYEGRDACAGCKLDIAAGPHTFTPDPTFESATWCGVCNELATEGNHPEVSSIIGQTEIPTGGAA